MTRGRPNRANQGFTLVEMLVAMTIFAILAAVGVSILRMSVDTQAAVDRQTRDGQTSRPAFVGEPGRIAFVRSGWSNLDDAPRSTLQRVEWRIADGGLARVGHRRIDGTSEEVPAVFARDSTASFRFREATGNWSTTYLSTERHPLPAAVEIVVKPRAASAVTVVIALPAIENRPPRAPQTPGSPPPPPAGNPA